MATAVTISCISISDINPIFFISLFISTPLICNASTVEVLDNPLDPFGTNLMCHKLLSKLCFQSVIGAINFIGNFPTPSELIIIAGRDFFISVPIVRPRFTIHISPLLGSDDLVINNISSLEILYIRILIINFSYFFCLFC